ncbi:uncharacterized protein LOC120159007 [Hibiscus syriacus]|uniref:uncharacterized protein LOC120159007 n=1 Tax=Hibiscus syriacus TaxID=106335 RepID=UPI001922F798|nr:uncharacterized protein LOC120159007 [Hibiscus syriacus]
MLDLLIDQNNDYLPSICALFRVSANHLASVSTTRFLAPISFASSSPCLNPQTSAKAPSEFKVQLPLGDFFQLIHLVSLVILMLQRTRFLYMTDNSASEAYLMNSFIFYVQDNLTNSNFGKKRFILVDFNADPCKLTSCHPGCSTVYFQWTANKFSYINQNPFIKILHARPWDMNPNCC